MNNTTNELSQEDAKSALDSIGAARLVAANSVKPPLWFRIMVSLLLGLLTLAGAWSSGNSLWTFVTLCSVSLLMASFLGFYFYLRSKGIKLSLKAKSRAEQVFSFIASFVVAFLIMFAIEVQKQGLIWLPYLAAALNLSVSFYIQTRYTMSGGKYEGGES